MKRPEGDSVFRQTLRFSRKLANLCLSGLAELKVAFFLVVFQFAAHKTLNDFEQMNCNCGNVLTFGLLSVMAFLIVSYVL